MPRRSIPAIALAFALIVASCSSSDDTTESGTGVTTTTSSLVESTTTTDPARSTTAQDLPALPASVADHESEIYDDLGNWLCHADLADDVCDTADLDVTFVAADGSTEIVRHERASDPPIDCFYVYPTVSTDAGVSADLDEDPAEINTTIAQAAFLDSQCRVFAPVYRQITLAGLFNGGGDRVAAGELAYGDVVDSFRTYLNSASDGRPFVLLGHSQGSSHLRTLIAEEIDGEPLLRERMVAAYLLGSTVEVPVGEVVGGSFDNVPACEARDQTGCVVSYATFRSTAPPESGAFFGVTGSAETDAVCVNPVDLSSGIATLTAPTFAADAAPIYADASRNTEITTRLVAFPDFLQAQCMRNDQYSWLEITVLADPDDPRADDIGGDLTPQWGLHIVDVSVAIGDIATLIGDQAAAFGEV